MTYLFHIAFKYLFSINRQNVVNIITIVSVVGVLVGTASMIIVLSIFNGFDDIIKTLYKNFDPDFKIELKEGKLFNVDNEMLNKIRSIDGVISCSEILEQKMLAQYLDYQLVVDAKGVDENYIDVTNLEKNLIYGDYFDSKNNFLMVGNGVFQSLSLKLLDFETPLKLTFFNETNMLDVNSSITTRPFYVTGVFNIQAEVDNTYVILNIDDLRNFLSIQKLYSPFTVDTKITCVNYYFFHMSYYMVIKSDVANRLFFIFTNSFFPLHNSGHTKSCYYDLCD